LPRSTDWIASEVVPSRYRGKACIL